MKYVNNEIIEKLIEAKKLEKEALMMLLPEKLQGHLEVIGNEVKAMLLDCVEELNMKDDEKQSANKESNKDKSPSKVRKVDID